MRPKAINGYQQAHLPVKSYVVLKSELDSTLQFLKNNHGADKHVIITYNLKITWLATDRMKSFVLLNVINHNDNGALFTIVESFWIKV